MRIGLDLRCLGNPDFVTRGVGRYILSLLPRMLETGNSVEFILLVRGSEDRFLPAELSTHPRVRILHGGHTYHASKRGLLGQMVQLPLQLARVKVHAWHFPFSEMAPPWLGKPYAVTIHDLIPVVHRPFYRGNKQLLFSLLQRGVYSGADRIIAVSAYSGSEVARRFHIPSKKITVIHHGVDAHTFFPVEPAVVRKRLHDLYGLEGPYFLYVGGFDQRKNVGRLVEVFAVLRAAYDLPHRLLIAGSLASGAVAVLKRVAQLRLQQNVLFLDYVEDDVLRLLYSGATALVFPSSMEGFGLPVLEALACGTPVITFDNTSLREVGGEAAIVLPDGDFDAFAEAMVAQASHKRSNPPEGAGIDAHLARFTWEQAAQATLQVYEELCASVPRPRLETGHSR
jgi:glycosyltransferase involved in cell wall biosynthesis